MTDSPKKPIFIIGPARSGTTIITQALRVGAQIKGHHEGHFLPLMHDLMSLIDNYFYTKRRLLENKLHMIAHVNKDQFKQTIIEDFRRTCEGLCPQEVWLDKSPDSTMVRCIDNLRVAWPKARFIFAKRRGIENICSRLRKFPHVDFESHCHIWANTMQSWLDVRDSLHGHFLEVEQRKIALNPQETAARLASFLDLNESQSVQIANVFTNKRPQSTGNIESKKALAIDETGWTPDQTQIYRSICGEVSTAMRYCETSEYVL